MKYYCGTDKPYIYAAYPEDKAECAQGIMEKLSNEGVQFWCGTEINKKELQRIKCAYAVLLFVNNEFLENEKTRKIVDCAVKNNKNILTVFLEDCKLNKWAHMQLDSAQAIFMKNFDSRESFEKKLAESEIFRHMAVTKQQKEYQKRRGISIVAVPLIAAAVLFFAVVYPFVILPSKQEANSEDNFGIKGLTQEELDSITSIAVVGNQIIDLDNRFVDTYFENGRRIGEVHIQDEGSQDGFEEYYLTSDNKGEISDISDLKLLRNLKCLRLTNQNVSDISALSELTSLEELYLEYNPVSSLEPIKNLKLTHLNIMGTNVTDLTPLMHMDSLYLLSFEDTPIKEVPELDCFKGKKLDTLRLDATQVTKMPYLGERENFNFSMQNIHYDVMREFDFTFLKDVKSFRRVGADNPLIPSILPYIENKPIRECCITGVQDSVYSPRDVKTLDVTEMMSFSYWNLSSLDGIESFNKVNNIDMRGCPQLNDYTPLLKLANLEVLCIDEAKRSIVEEQLSDASFEIVYVLE